MAIDIISVLHNGGLLPDIILLTQGYYHRGTRLNTMQWLCLYSLYLVEGTGKLFNNYCP